MADAQAVADLCAAATPKFLSLSTGGGATLQLDLRVLDADTIKSCFTALVTTIKTQSEQLATMKTALEAGDSSAMAAQIKELESALINLAQNVQGFTEDDAAEEEEESPVSFLYTL